MLKGFLILLCIILVGIIGLMLYIQFTQSSVYHGPRSAHFDGKEFFNSPPYKKLGVLDIFRWKLFGNHKKKWPEHVDNTFQPDLRPATKDEVNVTFVNHSTMLIQTEKMNLLTDPVWDYRTSPVSWTGPHRVRKPGIAFENLPRIDIVIVSHNHYDHLDINTLKKLNDKFHPVFLVPLGLKDLLTRHEISNVVEMDWWQTYSNGTTTITFLPTQHWSERWLNDKFKTLWGSYGILVDKHKIFFAGDSGYSKNFSYIKEKWGSPDLAFLPIGAYLPEWFMRSNHMNPAESLQAHEELGAKHSIGIHFGTFQLSDEGIDDPVKDLQAALAKKPALKGQFEVLGVGESKRLNLGNAF